MEPQRELQLAMVAVLPRHLHERIQGGGIGPDAVPVRVIKGIVGLGAELEARGFANFEVLEQTQIPILETGVVDLIANAVLVVERALGRLAPLQCAARAYRVTAAWTTRRRWRTTAALPTPTGGSIHSTRAAVTR